MQLEPKLTLANRTFNLLVKLDRIKNPEDRWRDIQSDDWADLHHCYEAAVRLTRMKDDDVSGPFPALKLRPTTTTREELIQRQTQEIIGLVMERRRRKNELRSKGPGAGPGSGH